MVDLEKLQYAPGPSAWFQCVETALFKMKGARDGLKSFRATFKSFEIIIIESRSRYECGFLWLLEAIISNSALNFAPCPPQVHKSGDRLRLSNIRNEFSAAVSPFGVIKSNYLNHIFQTVLVVAEKALCIWLLYKQ